MFWDRSPDAAHSASKTRVNALMGSGSAGLGTRRRAETALGFDVSDNALEAFALPEIGHDERPLAAHPPCVGVHFLQRRADIGRKVDLVDDQQVGAGDAGA